MNENFTQPNIRIPRSTHEFLSRIQNDFMTSHDANLGRKLSLSLSGTVKNLAANLLLQIAERSRTPEVEDYYMLDSAAGIIGFFKVI